MTALRMTAYASVMMSAVALSPVQAVAKKSTDGCVTDNGNHVLTCTCNCDSLKTACDNGGADWEDTKTGGKCTVGGGADKSVMKVFEFQIKKKPSYKVKSNAGSSRLKRK